MQRHGSSGALHKRSSSFQTATYTPEMLNEHVRTLQEILHGQQRFDWAPVDDILYLELPKLLLLVIQHFHEPDISG